MSAWEGSAMQEAQERKQKEIEQIKQVTRLQNPTLTEAEVAQLANHTYEEAHKPPARRCCPCRVGHREFHNVATYQPYLEDRETPQVATRLPFLSLKGKDVKIVGNLAYCPCACHPPNQTR